MLDPTRFPHTRTGVRTDVTPDDLPANAGRQAQEADLPVRAAAVLRIAHVESAKDVSRASQLLVA